MKISNWCKTTFLALAAGGWLTPADAYAVNIAIGDPSFEAFTVPTTGQTAGYAYATHGALPHYRPTSAWVSRPDDFIPGQSAVDGGPNNSNWIYNAAYAEMLTANFGGSASNPGMISTGRRPAPRTGNQAMHGRGLTSGQEISPATATFEAGKQYTFSVYAQGDSNAEIFSSTGWQSRIYLFIYDGTISFRDTAAVPPGQFTSQPNAFVALTYDPSLHDSGSPNYTFFPPDRFAPSEPIPPEMTMTHPGQFINRPANATAAESRAAWQKISISWLVLPGASEIGHPIGIAFRALDDAALDDAALTVTAGDLNVDGSLNSLDWNVLRSHQLGDLSALNAKERYFAGDLNFDGLNNHADFAIFKSSYDQANGPGSFVAMLASVPEPSMITLATIAGVFVALRRRSTRPVLG